MNSTIEEILYKNHKIEIDYDDYPENPREWENLGMFVTYSSKYSYGDNVNQGRIFDSRDELEECIHGIKDVLLLAIYVYDHSGVSVSTNVPTCGWDSSCIGYIYASPDMIEKWGTNADYAEKILIAEIEEYNQYLNGEVYKYTIEGPYTDESCAGYYDEAAAIDEAKREIDATLKWLSTYKKAKILFAKLYESTTEIIKEHWC